MIFLRPMPSLRVSTLELSCQRLGLFQGWVPTGCGSVRSPGRTVGPWRPACVLWERSHTGLREMANRDWLRDNQPRFYPRREHVSNDYFVFDPDFLASTLHMVGWPEGDRKGYGTQWLADIYDVGSEAFDYDRKQCLPHRGSGRKAKQTVVSTYTVQEADVLTLEHDEEGPPAADVLTLESPKERPPATICSENLWRI